MAILIVRQVDERIVQALRERAKRHGRSAEAEHRAILEVGLGSRLRALQAAAGSGRGAWLRGQQSSSRSDPLVGPGAPWLTAKATLVGTGAGRGLEVGHIVDQSGRRP